MDLIDLYRSMARARAFELAQADLWHRGLISGEMHLGTGEEAIAAGLVAHLRKGDAVALDHRPTPVLFLLGVDPVAMLREVLGKETGLCGGNGGHMHLFCKERLAASGGIVGASGPLAVGFALAACHLRPGSIAVAVFGDGAANQGMLLESFNLAVAWKIPVLFVCKQNGWAITTRTEATTGGDLLDRARAFALRAERVDGGDAMAVFESAGRLIERARGREPAFLLASCPRRDGHFLGDPLVAASRHPLGEGRELLRAVVGAAVARDGGGIGQRAISLARMTAVMRLARDPESDPLQRARHALRRRGEEMGRIEEEAAAEISRAVQEALA